MHILCEISHPAHVHFFRNAIDIWYKQRHCVSIIARKKDITLQLLDEYGYKYLCLSRARSRLDGLVLELIQHEFRLYKKFRRNPPDVLVGVGGTFTVHAAKLMRRPAIVFYDTEIAKISNAITYPFASAICTPDCYKGNIGSRHVCYKGYQELAYLHPNWFKPDPNILKKIGLTPDDIFFVVRFVGWNSSHEINQKGFSRSGKIKLVKKLEHHGHVIITSESPLPSELEPYRLKRALSNVHHLLAYATLYIGESATMASESVLLGTPAILVSPTGRGYTDEQEKYYDMCYTIHRRHEEKSIAKAVELIKRPNLKKEWREKRKRLLAEKIDVTEWMVNFVEKFVHEKSIKN